MRNTLRQTIAVARLEFARLVRTPATGIALLAFTAILVLGQWLHSRALPPRPDDDRLLGHAFLIACLLGLRFGIAADRQRGGERLIIGNLVRPVAYFLGKAMTLLCSLTIMTGFAILTGTIVSAGDLNHALWYSLAVALGIWIITPVLLLVELILDTRFPGPAALVLIIMLLLAANLTVGAQSLLRWLAFTAEGLDYRTLAPLAWRGLAVPAAFAVIYPLWRWRANAPIPNRPS